MCIFIGLKRGVCEMSELIKRYDVVGLFLAQHEKKNRRDRPRESEKEEIHDIFFQSKISWMNPYRFQFVHVFMEPNKTEFSFSSFVGKILNENNKYIVSIDRSNRVVNAAIYEIWIYVWFFRFIHSSAEHSHAVSYIQLADQSLYWIYFCRNRCETWSHC